MKTHRFAEPWANNYLAFNEPYPRGASVSALKEYHLSRLYWLAVLSRGVLQFIDERKIKGDPYAERLCRFVLTAIDRVADFSQLVHVGTSEYLLQIKTAQARLNGLRL